MTTHPIKNAKHRTGLLPSRLASAALMLCALGFAACAAEVGEYGEFDEAGQAAIEAEIQALLREYPDATRWDERSIAWDDGAVVLTLTVPRADRDSARDASDGPESVSSSSEALSSAHGCPSGMYCVYEHSNWNEGRSPNAPPARMLKFSDCTRNDLATYGFRDQTSSWVNNGSRKIAVWNAGNCCRSDAILWTMEPQSLSAWVGDSANDKADFFSCR